MSAGAAGSAPIPGPLAGPGELCAALVDLRAWAGSPSYSEIARRVEVTRLGRDLPWSEAKVARSTVYDCFRPGRRRLNAPLVLEIVSTLGTDRTDHAHWRSALRRALHPSTGLATSSASTLVPDEGLGLVGRAEVLARLLEGDCSTLITGMGGVGKTALALEAARRLVASGRVEGVVRINLAGFVDGRSPVEPSAAVDALLEACVEGPVPAGDPWESWHRLLDERAIVLLLDDAASFGQVAALLPKPGSSSRAILTSRITFEPTDTLDQLELRELGEADSLDLLRVMTLGVIGDQPEALELVRIAGGLPLGLVLLGKRLSAPTGWDLADHAAAYRRRAEHLRLEDGVQESIALTYARLDDDDRRALRLFAATPLADLSLSGLAALWECGEAAAAARIERVVAAHLVRPVSVDRWEMHDLVRLYARRRSLDEDAPTRLDSAVVRLVEHLLGEAEVAVSTTHPRFVSDWFWAERAPRRLEDPLVATAWLQAERANLVSAVAWCDEESHDVLAVQLAAILTPYLFDRADGRTLVALQQTAIEAAQRSGDIRFAALARRNLGIGLRRLGEYDAAIDALSTSLVESGEVGDDAGAAHARNHLAVIAHTRGDDAEAIRLLALVRDHYDDHPADEGLTQAVLNLGVILTRQSRDEEAIVLLEEAVRLAADQGWLVGEQMAYNNITTHLQSSGRYEEAEQAARRSLELATLLRRPLGIAYATATLASTRFDRGAVREALDLNLEARRLAQTLDAEELVLMTLNNAGDYHQKLGDLTTSHREYAAAFDLATERGDAFQLSIAQEGLDQTRA